MRLNWQQLQPDALKAMLGLERVANDGLADPRLLDLVKVRASQINGRAFCLRLHSREARGQGESDDRLDMIAVRREVDCFGRAERAALAWCEALTLAIVAINGWNRLNVAFRTPVSDADKVTHRQAA